MKRATSFALSFVGAIAMVVVTYVMLRPSGLQRTVETFVNFISH